MTQTLRILMLPLALAMFVVGFITGKWIIFGIIGISLIIFTSVFYSGRKQRVRYWIQGYKTLLENNGGDAQTALTTIQKEFCASKYADENVCKNQYDSISTLVEAIIQREFKFERLVQAPISSPNDVQKNLSAYAKAKEKLRKEVASVKKEILG
jgi:hypothetical protein